MQAVRDTRVAIVLAGGGATRLGAAAQESPGGKAALQLDGRPFLAHVVAAVAGEVGRTLVVAAPGQALPAVEGMEIVRDTRAAAGPLAGLADGLRAAVAAGGPTAAPRVAFVASCDAPLVRRDVVRMLLERAAGGHARWTVPVVGGRRQVLTSVLRIDMLPRIEAWMAGGRRDLRGLFAAVAAEDPGSVEEVSEDVVAAVDPTLASFLDVDTPDDLRRLHALAAHMTADIRLRGPGE